MPGLKRKPPSECKACGVLDATGEEHVYYTLVISFPEEGEAIVHNPEWNPRENDNRGWLALLRAVKQLKELGDDRVDRILTENHIQYRAPQK